MSTAVQQAVGVEPQLPDDAAPAPGGNSAARQLRGGCYLARLTKHPSDPASRYDGTLRVEQRDSGTLASGDLYVHGPDVDPSARVPLFPRALYRYYVRVTTLSENATGVDLAFELHRFEGDTWTEEGALTAALEWTSDDGAVLGGGVRDATGGDAGELELVWVSPYLRRAVIEVVRVPASDRPVSSAAGVDWRKIFDDVGWDLTIV